MACCRADGASSRPEKVCQLRDGTGGRNARIGFGIYKAIATESD